MAKLSFQYVFPACCTKISLALSGDALSYLEGVVDGIYYMQTGFINKQRYWLSKEGNAIWISNTRAEWSIGNSDVISTKLAFLQIPVKVVSCPYENLQSSLWYWNGKTYYMGGVSNSIAINCLKGKIMTQSTITFFFKMHLFPGYIQFDSNTYLSAPKSSEIIVQVERFHKIKERIEVNWRLSNNGTFRGLDGKVFFDEFHDQKVIEIDFRNVTANQSLQIELFEPSTGFQLGDNKVANITLVCKSYV